jgi:hypothetical protein
MRSNNKENFNQIDKFMAPSFAATGVWHVAGFMRVLPMTQHA